MREERFTADDLRLAITIRRFRVDGLALHVGLDVRTLQRRFKEQFHTTPQKWIMRERMNSAPTLLVNGFSNKEVAAALNYTCESNFCRAFKRHFNCAPQEFVRKQPASLMSHCDKQLSHTDNAAVLPWQTIF